MYCEIQFQVNSKGFIKKPNVVDKLNIPVYFLGGMGIKDLDKTLELGAQGIAGVSAF
jgi:8-oxo-dGTP diphosphatase